MQETLRIVDETKNRHVQGMPETRIPKRVINWKPPRRKKPGRLGRNW